jgi:hypothetical protein
MSRALTIKTIFPDHHQQISSKSVGFSPARGISLSVQIASLDVTNCILQPRYPDFTMSSNLQIPPPQTPKLAFAYLHHPQEIADFTLEIYGNGEQARSGMSTIPAPTRSDAAAPAFVPSGEPTSSPILSKTPESHHQTPILQ